MGSDLVRVTTSWLLVFWPVVGMFKTVTMLFMEILICILFIFSRFGFPH